jgi:hypothetical protein
MFDKMKDTAYILRRNQMCPLSLMSTPEVKSGTSKMTIVEGSVDVIGSPIKSCYRPAIRHEWKSVDMQWRNACELIAQL